MVKIVNISIFNPFIQFIGDKTDLKTIRKQNIKNNKRRFSTGQIYGPVLNCPISRGNLVPGDMADRY